MKRAALLLLLAATPVSAREAIGVFAGWGAFKDTAPARCFAIAQPVETVRGANWRPFATVTRWPAQNIREQLHVRLSRARDTRARVTLSIGERRFELVAGDADAWAPDKRTDFAIVAAMRSARSMSVESVGRSGTPFADVYALLGAATAIDAASVACGAG